MKDKYTFCGQNAKYFDVKADGTDGCSVEW
jgi:hypothetical protein